MIRIMPRSLPPLIWFRTFDCAARHGSFSRAAQELNLTQSAVSQHIRSLETRLGATLFTRQARGVALTDGGRQLLTYVAGAMADLNAAAELFSGRKQESVLEVACSSSFARLWLCRHIGSFQESHPGTGVRIVSALWPDEYTRVKADVQIRYGPAELVGEGAEQLLEDVVIPVCHPDLAPDAKAGDGMRDALLIHVLGTENTWDRWSQHHGTPPDAPPALHVDADELAIELAEQKQGIALCGRLLCQPLIQEGRLHSPFPGEMPSNENYYVALGGTEKSKDRAQQFRKWILETVGQSVRTRS